MVIFGFIVAISTIPLAAQIIDSAATQVETFDPGEQTKAVDPAPSEDAAQSAPDQQTSRSVLKPETGSEVIKPKDLYEGTGYFHPFVRMPSYIWQDQKAIWTSPFHTAKEDIKWWLVFGGVTGALIATDKYTSKNAPDSPDLTGDFCTSRTERLEAERNPGYAEESVYARADRAEAATD
jgi:hypothetical protein